VKTVPLPGIKPWLHSIASYLNKEAMKQKETKMCKNGKEREKTQRRKEVN
jgi:hypothetical protein